MRSYCWCILYDRKCLPTHKPCWIMERFIETNAAPSWIDQIQWLNRNHMKFINKRMGLFKHENVRFYILPNDLLKNWEVAETLQSHSRWEKNIWFRIFRLAMTYTYIPEIIKFQESKRIVRYIIPKVIEFPLILLNHLINIFNLYLPNFSNLQIIFKFFSNKTYRNLYTFPSNLIIDNVNFNQYPSTTSSLYLISFVRQ